MRSRWMTIGITFAALMLMLPVVALAQTSRVEGMALQGDYIKDYTGIYTYPSCLSTVGNLMYAELGSSATTVSDRAVGGVMDKLFDGKFGTWGIHLRQTTPDLGQGDALSSAGIGARGSDPNSNSNEAFDLMWGRKSGTSTLGVRVDRSYYKNKLETVGVTTNLAFDPASPPGNMGRNIMAYGVGLGFEMNADTHVDVAGQLQSRTFENSVSAPVAKNEDNGSTTYQIAIRAMKQWKPNVMIVPVFKLTSYDLSRKNTVGVVATTFDNSMRSWQIGVSSDWTLGTNDLMVWGVTFAQNRIEEDEPLFPTLTVDTGIGKATVTETIMPQVFAALETHVNNWLTLRFGASKAAFSTLKIENKGLVAATRTISSSTFNMNLGAGVKVGQLQLDAILANNFAQDLGSLFSGTTGSYFPKVTATYAF